MSRNITFSPDEYYHCYSRGTEKRKVFLDKADYHRFIHLLFICNSESKIHLSDYKGRSFTEIFEIDRGETLVDVGAYCLMTNHFHLLLKEKKDGNISLFMQKLMTAYTMYFNKRYERSGALFESRFRAKHCDTDEYLKYIFSYIHLNPIKLMDPKWKESGIKNKKLAEKFLSDYEYSSYLDYMGENRAQGVILNRKSFPEYFPNKKEFEMEIFDWIDSSNITVKVEP